MIVVEAVVLRELQSKLYGVACNHVPAPSLAPAIVRLPATHSAHELFVNVNVGPVLSNVYTSVSTRLVLQLFNASQDIAFKVVVALND